MLNVLRKETSYQDDFDDDEVERKMATKLDEISRAIGGLESDSRAAKEGMNNIHSKIDKLLENIDKLPPSPQCIQTHIEIRREISDMKIESAWRAGYISGGVAVAAVAGKWLLAKLGLVL